MRGAADHIPVLLYHSVREVPLPGLARWTASPARFQEHVRAILDAGRTPLTMSALADALRGARPLPERPLAITFDDGVDDTLPAIATLVEAGLSATAYVTTGALGERHWLDAAAVRALDALADDVEIGAHSVTHPRVDELSGAALQAEVRGSKAALEDVLGHAVAGFAYPHGAHDRRSRAAVVGAGYTHAAAVKDALSHPADDPFAIARWTVEADATAVRIAEVLEGRDVPRAWTGDRLSTSAYRQVRRLRRRLGVPA